MTESLKPIEPGCLAILLSPDPRSKFTGKIFRVIRFVGEYYPWPEKDHWEVSPHGWSPPKFINCPVASESILMRIDPDSEIKNEEQECLTEKS